MLTASQALLGVSVLTIAFSANSQDVKHAPTLEQCTADINLWLADYRDQKLTELTFGEMAKRRVYLNDCRNTYLALEERTSPLQVIYELERSDRLFHFIARHDLVNKFLEEDEAGKR